MENSDSTYDDMNCSIPPALTNDDLLAAIDGNADSSIQSHLDRCASCSARLEEVRDLETAIKRVMYRADCPPAERLADYAMRLLITSDAALIERHIKRCARCRNEVELLEANFTSERLAIAKMESEAIGTRLKRPFRPISGVQPQILYPSRSNDYSGIKGAGQRSSEYMSGSITVMLSVQTNETRLRLNASIIDRENPGQWRGGYAEFASAIEGSQGYLAEIDEDETLILYSIAPGTYHANLYSTEGKILRLHDIELAR